MKEKGWAEARRVLVIFLGCLLLAVAYNMAFDPNHMVTGGVSGLGIVVKELTKGLFPGGVPLWLSTLVLNIPIYIAAWIVRGRRFIMHSLMGTLLLTLALAIVPFMDVMAGDRILASIFGAVAGGAGVALVLMNGASTGGTDMLAMVLVRLIPGSNVSNLIFLLDGAVVVTGAVIFGIPSTLYAILGVFLIARVTDVVLTGQKDARMIYCISSRNREIASEIMEKANRGVSRMQITGMYTGEEKNMLMCVVSRRQIVQVKRIIRNHDPRAFVIISNVSDVRGEGFAADILEND